MDRAEAGETHTRSNGYKEPGHGSRLRRGKRSPRPSSSVLGAVRDTRKMAPAGGKNAKKVSVQGTQGCSGFRSASPAPQPGQIRGPQPHPHPQPGESRGPPGTAASEHQGTSEPRPLSSDHSALESYVTPQLQGTPKTLSPAPQDQSTPPRCGS